MLDILLIQPPYRDYDTQKISIFDPTNYMECHPPLGLAYLAAYVRDEFSVAILDMEAEKIGFSQLDKILDRYRPSMVGISVTSPLYAISVEIARRVKKIKDIPIVLGGVHVNLMPDVLEESCFDFAVRREGEEPLKQLLTCLLRGTGKLEGIGNLSYRRGGKIADNPDLPVRDNLDELPYPARDLLNLDRYFSIGADSNPVASVITSRGCPFHCIFCNPIYSRVRQRSIGNVIAEIEEIIRKYQLRHIDFFDETFNLDREWVIAFCREVIRRQLPITWRARCRVNLFDEELVRWMKKAGCSLISLGIESINDATLEFLRKGTTSRQVRDSIRLIKAEGIDIHGWFILGAPTESRRDMMNTVRFAKRTDLDYALFSILTPMPKSELETIAIERHWIAGDFLDYGKYINQNKPILRHPELTEKQILRLTRFAQVTFYLKWGRLWNLLTKLFKDRRRYLEFLFKYLRTR